MNTTIRIHDPESWGKALSFSTGLHACFLMLMLIQLQKTKAPEIVLTDINFLEGSLSSDQPTPALPTSKGEGDSGSGGGDKKGSGSTLAPVSGQGPIRSHPELSNKALISSDKGTPEGEVVVSQPMTGPIVPIEDYGLVGRSKGALKPFVAQTEGKPGQGASLPKGTDYSYQGPQIILAKAKQEDLRRAEASLGTPIFSEKVSSSEGLPGRLKELADRSLGAKSKATAEHLKANPFDKEKWGNQKGPFSMEGPLKYRKILKMELPPYPRWAEEKALEAAISIRLWVDPKGVVKDNMYLERTSGYSELDHLAMEALRRFVFVPIPNGQPQEDEWGVATFRFELKKK